MATKLSPQQLRAIMQAPKGKLPRFLDVRPKNAVPDQDAKFGYRAPTRERVIIANKDLKKLPLKRAKIVGPV